MIYLLYRVHAHINVSPYKRDCKKVTRKESIIFATYYKFVAGTIASGGRQATAGSLC